LGQLTLFSLAFAVVMFLLRAYTVEDVRRVFKRLSAVESPGEML
jgi:hypothetical protein